MALDFGPRRDASEYLNPTHQYIFDHFVIHGREVTQLLRKAANSPRGLQALAQQLGERVDYDDVQQLELLGRFIRKYGTEILMARLGQRDTRAAGTQSGSSSEAPAASAPTPAGECPAGKTTGQHFDEGGKYSGPERRGDSPRRQLKRRDACEAIQKNQRYGGDRRQGDRRRGSQSR